MKISVFDIIQNETAAFQEEGEMIYILLEKSILKGEAVELSFEEIEMCSSRFLNASIGRLYSNYGQDRVNSFLTVSGITQDNEVISSSIERAIDIALRPKLYEDIAKSALVEV